MRLCTRKFLSIAGLAAIGLLVPAGTALAAPASPICSTSFNPYQVSATTVEACGGQVFLPQSTKTNLAGGARSSTFDVDGMRVTYKAPPASFNPADASEAELSTYGLTPPPAGSHQRALWEKAIGHMHFLAPPQRQVIYPNTRVGAAVSAGPGTAERFETYNWSGRVNDEKAQAFNTAEGLYLEPSSVTQTCSEANEVQWVGLGGWNSGALEQNGTANDVPGLSQHQAWWEILPAGIAPIEFSASAPGYFEAETQWVSATVAKFRFVNYVTDYSVTVEVEGTFSSDRSTAEYIIERPAFSEGELVWLNPLADYHSSEWYAFTNGEELEKLPFNTAYMVDQKGTAMSSPGKLEGYYFPMSFENCGERTVLHE